MRFASPHVDLASTPETRRSSSRSSRWSSSSRSSSSCVTRRSNASQRASTVVRAVIFAIVSLSGNSDRFLRRWCATLSSLVNRLTRTLRSEPEPTSGGSEPSRSTRRTRTRPTRNDTVAGRDFSLPSIVVVVVEEEEEEEEDETRAKPSSKKFEEVSQPRPVHPLSSTKSTSPTSSSTPTHTARRSLALYLALMSTRASSRYPRVESPPPAAAAEASFGRTAAAPTTTRSTIAVHVTPLPLNAVVAATTALAAV